MNGADLESEFKICHVHLCPPRMDDRIRPRVSVYLELEQSGLLADGHHDVTSTSVTFVFLYILSHFFSMAGRQAGKQHLLVTWTGAKTTEFP